MTMHQSQHSIWCRTFRFIAIAIVPGTVLALPTIANAGPPTQLYGKSISVSWTESRDRKFISGETRHVIAHTTFGVYVSSNGRIFTRVGRTSDKPGRVGRSSNFSLGR